MADLSLAPMPASASGLSGAALPPPTVDPYAGMRADPAVAAPPRGFSAVRVAAPPPGVAAFAGAAAAAGAPLPQAAQIMAPSVAAAPQIYTPYP